MKLMFGGSFSQAGQPQLPVFLGCNPSILPSLLTLSHSQQLLQSHPDQTKPKV